MKLRPAAEVAGDTYRYSADADNSRAIGVIEADRKATVEACVQALRNVGFVDSDRPDSAIGALDAVLEEK